MNFVNPSHVLLFPNVSFVACPKLESEVSSTLLFDFSCLLSNPNKFDVKSLNPPNPLNVFVVESLFLFEFDKSFNSFSKVSNSFKSNFTLLFSDFLVLFISNSTPGPKLEELLSLKFKLIGSKLSNPISKLSISYDNNIKVIFKSYEFLIIYYFYLYI